MSSGDVNEQLRNLRHYFEQVSSQFSLQFTPADIEAARHIDLSNSKISEETPEEVVMAESTLRTLGAPNVDQQPLCIEIPVNEEAFELKSGLIHLLPSFNGLAGEDPNKHLKEIHVVCSSMKPARIPVDQVKLRAFPFSLNDSAKEWLYYLPPGSILTWQDMARAFLDRYFPASRAATVVYRG